MNPHKKFQQDRLAHISAMGADNLISALANRFVRDTAKYNYSYNFQFAGRPIIQFPQDMVAVQELIWQIKPGLIIETGIAHGGSLIMSASMLSLLDHCDAIERGVLIDPRAPRRRVLGVDIDIRAHNRAAIEAHPMANRIDMIEGSSVDPAIIAQVQDIARGYERVLVCLIQIIHTTTCSLSLRPTRRS